MKNLEDKRINSFADDTDYKLRSCDKHCCKYAETFYIVLRALQETFLRISFSKQDNEALNKVLTENFGEVCKSSN